jgi:hypothetical protein
VESVIALSGMTDRFKMEWVIALSGIRIKPGILNDVKAPAVKRSKKALYYNTMPFSIV